ncbi:MAG: YfhO family protein, partial [Lachnospiraceae bacterium]|nr:YfhO family protein [Lachnospiraceae bacterium]
MEELSEKSKKGHLKKERTMDGTKAKTLSRLYFLAGFLLSGVVALVGFALMGVWPFGDKTLLIIDSLHQYLPFYTDFHEKLVDGESLLYSFSGGLGYNLWSTIAYYLASPLNLLMVLIPTANVCDFMDLMILLKIALCGGCFSWYMHKRDEERTYLPEHSPNAQRFENGECDLPSSAGEGALPVVFGMMYALSNFVIGYYFNLMWLDSVAMLPLIMYGIEQIVKGKSGRFYCLALFYGLWCNYYIGFMLCLFSCLYFLVRWIAQTGEYGSGKGQTSASYSVKRSFWRDLGKSCLTFAWHSLLAGGMSALMLVPAFMGLTSSESMESNTFPTVVKFYESLAELLENHMAFMEPVTISSSQVGLNVYCGVATVLLAVLYLFDREVRLRERLAHYGLCALLLFSFACNIPNYIWHGFHQQNGLPNRFAFIYIAIVLVMAYDALGHLKKFWLPEMLFAVAAPCAFLIVRYLDPDQELEGYLFLISLGLLIFYFVFLLIGRYVDRLKPSVFRAALTCVMVVEIAANAIYGISQNGSVTRSIYLADQTSYQALIAELDEDE